MGKNFSLSELQQDYDAVILALGELQREIPALSDLSWAKNGIEINRKTFETSIPGIYLAGDNSGIEEASSAMMEGRIAGLSAAEKILGKKNQIVKERKENQEELEELRRGPFGEKIRIGNQKLLDEARKNGLY